MIPIRTAVTAAVLVYALILGWAQPAHSATVSLVGGVLKYRAAGTEENNLEIRGTFGGNYHLTEVGGVSLTPDPSLPVPGCFAIDSSNVGCDAMMNLIIDVDLAAGDDRVLIDATYASSQIQGGAGNDPALVGGNGIDHIDGGPGNDDLSGGLGEDTLLGDMGLDALSGDDGVDHLFGGDQDDLLLGGAAGDTLSGGAGSDSLDSYPRSVSQPPLTATAGNDDLQGDSGDDLFAGSAEAVATNGVDTFSGGEGRDTADYSAVAASIALSLDGAPNDGGPGNPDNLLPDVEVLIGTPFADVLSGSAADNLIDGRGADDRMFGNGGSDLLIGGEADIGSDTLNGGEGADTLLGGPGDDGLDGGGANDTLQSGPGADSLAGAAGDDLIEGGPGIDGLTGGAGNDTLRGGAVDLVGGDSGDNLDGDAGSDVLEGDLGDDSLDGGAGSDVLRGGEGGDTAEYEKRGAPVVASLDDRANDGEAREADNVARDVEDIRSGTKQDDLIGSQASNGLQSGEGEDYVDGAVGADALAGGPDRDTVRARDGVADRVSCGGDVDFAIVDTRDRVDKDCERVDRGRRNRPRLARSAVTTPVRGKLRLNVRGTKRFVPLQDRVNVPFGSAVDASAGAVRLTSVQSARGHRTAVATFSDGTFKTTQRRSRRPVTDIRLAGGDFDACRPSARRESRARKRKVIQELLGKGKGRFSTSGRYSATTVRGTTWVVEDRCDGTLTRVLSGSAEVEDFARHKTVIVNAGERYLARPGR